MTTGYFRVDTLFELITCVCVCVCACVNLRPSIQNQDLDAEVTLLRTPSRDAFSRLPYEFLWTIRVSHVGQLRQ